MEQVNSSLCVRCKKNSVAGKYCILQNYLSPLILGTFCLECSCLVMAVENCKKKVVLDHAEEMYQLFVNPETPLADREWGQKELVSKIQMEMAALEASLKYEESK